MGTISLGFILAVLAAVLALFLALSLLPMTPAYVGATILLVALARLC